eukprot:7903209-Pyramimonas_sp.AAC.1
MQGYGAIFAGWCINGSCMCLSSTGAPRTWTFFMLSKGPGPPVLDPMWVLGNSWADYFAKRGAAEIAIAKGYVEYVQHVFDEGTMMARYLSCGLARLFSAAALGERKETDLQREVRAL